MARKGKRGGEGQLSLLRREGRQSMREGLPTLT